MDIVESRAKKYEELSIKYNINYNKIVDAIGVVKQFIIDNNLILYGGTAIDYALKLKGDCIYADDTLPDLDFYSYDNVAHAYDLTDILYKLGNNDVRTIRALYVQTMRIDLVDNNFIADITFVPKNIFETLPTLLYDRMRIIHPSFQKIDLHRSLSFPYEYAPHEAIFARWKKDIVRFNKLQHSYPAASDGTALTFKYKRTLPKKYLTGGKYIVGGFAAYAILCRDLEYMGGPTNTRPRVQIENGALVFDVPYKDAEIELFTAAKDLEAGDETRPYMSIMPKSILVPNNIRIYVVKNKLISMGKSTIDKKTICHLSIQPLLYTLAFNAHKHKKRAPIYNACYCSALKMIGRAQKIILDEKQRAHEKVPSLGPYQDYILNCPFLPITNIYGAKNEPETYDILINKILTDMGEAKAYYVPTSYYPASKKRPPEFLYANSKFFRKDGRPK